ncbi:hypothetical protein [Cryobacterium sp. AP23]
MPIPTGVTGGTGSSAAPVIEYELDVAGNATGAEAPAVAYPVLRHTPFHRALEAGQRFGRYGIDRFGDASLWLRAAGDVGEDWLVADRRSCGTRSACHGFREYPGCVALRRTRGRFLDFALADRLAVHGEMVVVLPLGRWGDCVRSIFGGIWSDDR